MSFVRNLTFIVFALVLAIDFANALVLGLNGQDSQIENYISGQREVGIHETQVSSTVKTFDNGNIFVVINTPVFGKHIDVVVPAVLNPDDFVEALIKVRTLRDLGAAHIAVRSFLSIPLRVIRKNGKSLELPINQLLAAAGADAVNDSQIFDVFRMIPKLNRYIENFIISGDGTLPITKALAKVSGREFVATKDLNKLFSNGETRVLYVTGQGEDSNERFLRALNDIALLTRNNYEVVLLTPYLPYARSDKIDQEGITVSGKLMADLISLSGAKWEIFVRAHAAQSQGFFSLPTTNISSQKTISEYLMSEDVDVLVSPDTGAQKDVTKLADEIGRPVAVVNKQRDPRSGVIRIVDMVGPSVVKKNVAIVDDETASGGTLAEVADFLHKRGAKRVVGIVSHLTGTAQKALGNSHLEEIVALDTMLVQPESKKIKILSVAPEVAEAINKIFPVSSKSCLGLFL